jgi:hypothetical protein
VSKTPWKSLGNNKRGGERYACAHIDGPPPAWVAESFAVLDGVPACLKRIASSLGSSSSLTHSRSAST